MQLSGKCIITPDAPLHVSNFILERMSLPIGQKEPTSTDYFVGPERPSIFARHADLDVRLTFYFEIVQNPLIKAHSGYASSKFDAEVMGEVDSFDPEDTKSYWNTRNRFDRSVFFVVNKVIEFFRYKLGNPFLRPLNIGHRTKWDWIDVHGSVIYKDPGFLLSGHFPGMPGSKLAFGSQPLRPSQVPDLLKYILDDVSPTLLDTLRSSARDAVLLGELRVAALNLAILAEVAIKNAFFRRDQIVSEAYDFLEEKGHVEVSPIELVNQVAARAFGERFIDHDSLAAEAIENLFRCRNKIAHRGALIYRDKKGNLSTATEDTLREWWDAVEVLIHWLGAKTANG